MIKIFGIASQLNPIKKKLSDTINSCMVETLSFPPNKRCHRFFPMEKEDFFYPEGRSDAYTVIEISMMEGRTVETKRRLIKSLFTTIERECGIAPIDLEISIFESPPSQWGFRGITGDEAKLDYQVTV